MISNQNNIIVPINKILKKIVDLNCIFIKLLFSEFGKKNIL